MLSLVTWSCFHPQVFPPTPPSMASSSTKVKQIVKTDSFMLEEVDLI
jgi:hypothetical protein